MMKKILFACLVVILLLPASLSAKEVVRLTRYENQNLTGVSAWFLFHVELIPSTETKAVVEIPLELENYLVFEKDAGGIVIVDMRLPEKIVRDLNQSINYWDENKLVLKIYTPTLKSIHLRGTAKLKAYSQFNCDTVAINIEGAGKIEGLNLQAKRLGIKLDGWTSANMNAVASSADIRVKGSSVLDMELNGNTDLVLNVNGTGKLNLSLPENDNLNATVNGAGNITLTGKGNKMDIDASGTGKVIAKEFMAKSVNVSASSLSKVSVQAKHSLNIHTSSASAKVEYMGNPTEIKFNNPNVVEIK